MDIYKKLNVGLSVATALIAGGIWVYWDYVCGGYTCSYDLTEKALRPLLWSSIPLTIIFATLLFFPTKLFKQWLLYIASWSILVSLLMILNTDPRSSNILSFDRGQVAWLLGSIIFLITIIYAVGWHLYEWRKGRIPASGMLKLSIFFVPTALFYTIWQLF